MRTEVALEERVLEGYGMRQHVRCLVARPRSAEEIARVFAWAAANGRTVGLRGGGCSYGDASLNGPSGPNGRDGDQDGDQVVLDCSLMNRVLAWDAGCGKMTVEPGVTIAQVWQHALADGWWPAVVPGTMAVTIGGAAAANIHGKNNWRDGAFGDHVSAFALLLPSGEQVTCSRQEHSDLFYAAIGGFGLLGCFTSLTIQLRRVYSGLVRVRQTAHGSLDDLLAALDAGTAETDDTAQRATHLVGWIDTSARGPHLGRGLLKAMRELAPGEDPHPERTLDPRQQPPSGRIAGILPATWVPILARPLATPLGIRAANLGQWVRGNLPGQARPHDERYVPANFMLNFIPNFRDLYRPGGLIQHQSFIPRESAREVFAEVLERSQRAGLTPALAVLKKHRPSPDFVLNYLCDGYSLALDYAVSRAREARTLALMDDLNALVASRGGTFFLAKDSTLTGDAYAQAFGQDRLERFATLKAQYDPTGLIQTNLYRRVLAPAMRASDVARGSLRGVSR